MSPVRWRNNLANSLPIYYGWVIVGSTVSVNSLVGLMLLTGLTINNVILISDKHRRYLRDNRGLDDNRVIALACGSRIRATTVTTFTTVLSLLPLALGIGSNGAIMQPLGISVASGLLLSLVFCLLLTPVLLQLTLPLIKRGLTEEEVPSKASYSSSRLMTDSPL